MTPFSYDPSVDKTSNRYLFQGGITSISEENLKETMDENFKSIVLSLLELPVYRNIRLLNSSLVMLRSIFEQRKELVDNFKSIIICG